MPCLRSGTLKIEEQADAVVRESKIGDELRLVNWSEGLNGF